MLSPDFEAVPAQLRELPRWVVHRDKVPYCATAINSKASSTNPDTWATFEQARAAYELGGYGGIGFVLNGDGVVGVDLDHCVASGTVDPAALALMDRIGCQYVELSPSATGLRGFGYGDSLEGRRKRGSVAGVSTELYSTGRHLTVTGRTVRDGLLVDLAGLHEVAEAIRSGSEARPTEESEDTEEHRRVRGHSSDSSDSSDSSVGAPAFDIPPDTLPGIVGERNKCLFKLARYVKGRWPGATLAELRPLVREWHRLALPAIGTADFSESWGDFARGLEAVRQPHGSTLRDIVAGAADRALPDGLDSLGYGSRGLELVRVCMALASYHDPEPFFVSSRVAGEVLGIHHTDAARMLAALCADGVVTLTKRGVGRVASRYRFTWNGGGNGEL